MGSQKNETCNAGGNSLTLNSRLPASLVDMEYQLHIVPSYLDLTNEH
jgi:hypothetical protein